MMLSVALCTYNGERYIREQIESILNQTIPVDEIVICDDGSTDNTLSLVNSYCLKTPKIKVYQNSEKLGVSKNFNKAVSLCRGDIVFFSDQDDIWYPNKVSTIINYFESNPNIDVVFSDADLIDTKGNVLSGIPNTLWEYTFNSNDRKLFQSNLKLECFLAGNHTTGATMAIRRSFYIDNGFLHLCNDEMLHDYAVTLIAAEKKRIGMIENKLIGYRIHAAQTCGLFNDTSQDYVKKTYYSIYVINKYIRPFLKEVDSVRRADFLCFRLKQTCRAVGALIILINIIKYSFYYKQYAPRMLWLDEVAWAKQMKTRLFR